MLSARYAGPGKKAEDNVRKLLSELKDVPAEQDGRRLRTARFRCVVAYVSGSGEKVFEGRVEGEIAAAPSGKDGFGYDPVFLPENTAWRRLSPSLRMSRRTLYPTAVKP